MTNTEPVAVINISLGDPIGTSYEGEPITLRSMVVEHVSRQLLQESQNWARQLLREKLEDQISKAAEEIVREAVASPIRKTNTWGEERGPETTVRDELAKEVQRWLTGPAKAAYGNSETNLSTLIKSEAGVVLASDMRKAFEEGKDKVRAAIAAQGAEVMQDILKKALR